MKTIQLFPLLFLLALLVPSVAAAQRRDTLNPRAPVVQPPTVTPTPTPIPTPSPVLAAPNRAQPDPGTPCCNIMSIVGVNVTAQDAATGTTIRFRVTDRAVLSTLAVGAPVWADLAANRIGFAAGNLCCAILGTAVANVPVRGAEPPGAANVPVRGAEPPGAANVPVRGAEPPGAANVPVRGAEPPGAANVPVRGAEPPGAANVPVRGAEPPGAANVPVRGAEPPGGRLAGGAAGRLGAVAADPGYKILQRTPVAFQAFVAADVGSGATPDRQLSLPNGRSLTVAAYLAELNGIEERLNGIGYSLRDLGESPEDATVIEEPALTPQQLGSQSSAITSTHLRRGAASAAQAAEASEVRFQQSFEAGRANSAAIAQALAGRGGGSVPHGIEKSWGLPIGDPQSVWVSLDGDFSLDGDADGTTMEITQRARGSVLDHDLEFLSLTGTIESPVSDAGEATLELRVLGNTVPVFLETPGAQGLSDDGVTSNPVTWTFTNPLSVGGVGMDVEFRIGGLAGVQYYVAAGGGSAIGVVTPFVNVSAGATIEVIDAYVVDSGVDGDLVVLDDRLTLAGSASLQYDNAAGKPYVYYDYLGVNDFVALQGDLNVYVCANVISNWQWKKKCWRKYLWKEDGIDLHDTLFMGNEKVYFD